MMLMLLILYGTESPTRKISEDRFLYELYAGNISNPEIVDSHQIRAEMADPEAIADGVVRVTVNVPNTAEMKDQVREMNARQLEDAYPIGAFLEKLENNTIQPLTGFPVRLKEWVDSKNPEKGVQHLQRFFVEFADDSGLHYSEVVGTGRDSIDLLALTQAITTKGGEIQSGLSFDAANGLTTESKNSFLIYFFSTIGPILLLGILFWFLFMRTMRGQGQGLMSFGNSKAKVYDKENRTNVSFKDVAGIDEAKDEVGEIIQFLKYPEKFHRLGGRIPRGVLLVGQPGTGKTLLAKAIAGEAEVPFLSISGSDFVEMFVGVGASRVRDLFEQARKSAPCIVFLDEIDAVGRKRGSGMGGGNDEREQTLNAILVEMDGFGTDEGIIVMAATNRPDVLDAALLRPGRFDREIVIDLPDVHGREMILGVHTKEVTVADGVNLATVARGTPGFSGAELAALVNEAAINAAMADRDAVTMADFEEARDKVRFGREKKSRVLEPEDKRITAYHEAGHAVVNEILPHTEPVHKVTIIPRGMALGATMMLPEKDRMHMTKKQMHAELAVLYGGRVAEEIFCDDITAGASNDIQRATQLAKLMITEWGMSEQLGAVNLADRSGSDFLGSEISVGKDHSEATVREIDEEVRGILKSAHVASRELIQEKKDMVERVAEALLLYETISGEEVKRLISGDLPVELRPQPAPPPLPESQLESPEEEAPPA